MQRIIKDEKIGAIIQARINSTRLYGKIFSLLGGKPILEHIVQKLSKSHFIDEVIIATSDNDDDTKIVNWCKKKNIKYFTGEKHDVLSRFYNCALKYKLDTIVRVTSDNPLIDIEIVDEVIRLYQKKYDYVANNVKKTFPHGLDVEVFNFSSLEKSFFDSKNESNREHVTQYIRQNQNLFKIANYESINNYHDIRVTLDTKEDFEAIKEVVKIGGIDLKLSKLVQIYNENTWLYEINRHSKETHDIYNKKNNII